MVTKNRVAILLSGCLVLSITTVNAEIILNGENDPYNSVAIIEPSQIPSDKSITQLIDIYNLDESINDITGKSEAKRQAVIDAIYSSMGIDITDTDRLSEEQKDKLAKLNEVMGAYADYIFDNRKDEMLDIYRQGFRQALKSTYTQEEIDAQIEFYSTPMGRKVIKKQSVFTEKYYGSILPKIMEIQNENTKEAVIQLAEDIKSLENEE